MMDILQGKIRNIYFKYLMAAFGSAMIVSVYSLVDMAVVGQYEGPKGSAALAVVAPVWNTIYSLGLLMGIGGAVLFSSLKAQSKNEDKSADEYFTVSVIGSCFLSALVWASILFFEKEILMFFGADKNLLIYAQSYLQPIKFVLPLFLFNQMMAAFLRNDNVPQLATKAVLAGGIFNIIGDCLFVFVFKMGIYGAGLATAIGSVITFAIMISHFFSRKNTLHLVKTTQFLRKTINVAVTGFSTFFVDFAMGILTILFNRQIIKYLGTDALAVYGPIINISTIVQCCAYSVGQAAQPIISANFGAQNWHRIKETLKYSLFTVAFFSLFWTILSLAFPNMYIYIFMAPTKHILEIAPSIIRIYSLSFILLPLNIFSTYYFQALMKPKIAFVISVFRGFILSGLLILILPAVFQPDSLWMSMPITEFLTTIYVIWQMKLVTKQLGEKIFS